MQTPPSFQLGIGSKTFSSWSLRAWLIMTYSGLSFKERLYHFDMDEDRTAFKKESLTGLVPFLLLTDSDNSQAPSFQIADSLAMGEYMAELAPHLWPMNQRERAVARMICAVIHSGIVRIREKCPMNLSCRFQDFTASEAVLAELNHLQNLITPYLEEAEKQGYHYLFGNEPTIVDAFLTPVASRIHSYYLPVDNLFHAYCNRLLTQPAMESWLIAARNDQTDHMRLANTNGRFGEGLKTIGDYALLNHFNR